MIKFIFCIFLSLPAFSLSYYNYGSQGGSSVVTVNTPLSGTGSGADPIVISSAGPTSDGYVKQADYNAFNGKLGTVTHDATLQGDGTVASPLNTISASSTAMSGAVTLTMADNTYQIFYDGDSNRDIILSTTSMTAGKVFFIINGTSGGGTQYTLSIKYEDGTLIDYVARGEMKIFFLNFANAWIPNHNGDELTLGFKSKGGLSGTTVLGAAIDGAYTYRATLLGYGSGIYGANGDSALVAGGFSSRAGKWATALGTNYCFADAVGSIAIGTHADGVVPGEIAFSQGYYGENRHRKFGWYGITSSTDTPTEIPLYNGDSGQRLVMDNTSVIVCDYVASAENPSGDVKAWEGHFAVKRVGTGTPALVGTIEKNIIGADAGASTYDIDFLVSGTYDALILNGTGDASAETRFTAAADCKMLSNGY